MGQWVSNWYFFYSYRIYGSFRFLKKHPRSIPLFAQNISLNATLVWRISLNATIAGHIYSSKHIARVNKSTKLSRSIVKLLVQFVHPVKLNIKKAVWIRSFIRMLNIYVSPIQSSGKKCLHLRQPGPHHSLGATSFDVAWCGPSILDVEHSLFQGRVSFRAHNLCHDNRQLIVIAINRNHSASKINCN